jgi:hypothetical protein
MKRPGYPPQITEQKDAFGLPAFFLGEDRLYRVWGPGTASDIMLRGIKPSLERTEFTFPGGFFCREVKKPEATPSAGASSPDA